MNTINNPTNLIAVFVKYLPASAAKGSRVKLTLRKSSRIVPYDHEYRTAEDVALAFLAESNLAPEHRACMPDGGSVLLFDFKHATQLHLVFSK